jgi:hypothetical protein
MGRNGNSRPPPIVFPKDRGQRQSPSTPTPLPTQLAQKPVQGASATVRTVEVKPTEVRTWVAPEANSGSLHRESRLVHTPQHFARSRDAYRPLNLGPIVALANKDLEDIDTSMFSLGEEVDPNTFPRKRY